MCVQDKPPFPMCRPARLRGSAVALAARATLTLVRRSARSPGGDGRGHYDRRPRTRDGDFAPPGKPLATGDLELITGPIAPLRDGQALVRTLVLSVGRPAGSGSGTSERSCHRSVRGDARYRRRRSDRLSAPTSPPGDVVAGFLGWQEFCVADDGLLEAHDHAASPLRQRQRSSACSYTSASATWASTTGPGPGTDRSDLCRGGRRGVDQPSQLASCAAPGSSACLGTGGAAA